jgi:hypothetical protein
LLRAAIDLKLDTFQASSEDFRPPMQKSILVDPSPIMEKSVNKRELKA